jgi:hypothetical protein
MDFGKFAWGENDVRKTRCALFFCLSKRVEL